MSSAGETSTRPLTVTPTSRGRLRAMRRGPVAAIALADEIDRRRPALMPGQPTADDRAQRVDIALHIPERLVRVVLLALAVAEPGADRIDKDEIGEGEPGRGIVDKSDRGRRHRAGRRRVEDARPERAEMQKHRGGAGAAVEHEGDRPPLAGRRLGQIGDRKDRCGRLALLVGYPDRLGNRTVIERMVAQCDAVAGLDALRRLSGRGLVVGNRRNSQRSCREAAADEGERSTPC